jgi:hypothetical protein
MSGKTGDLENESRNSFPTEQFSHGSLNRKISFLAIDGKVAADKIWSETHVTSSGGGGTLHDGSGYISAAQVSSRVATKREIWIRPATGPEVNLITGFDVRVNSGHDVSVIYCGADKDWTPIALVNRTTSYWHTIRGTFEEFFLRRYGRRFGAGSRFLLVLCVVAILFSVAALLVRSLSLIGIVVGGGAVRYLADGLQTRQGSRKGSTAFDEHCKIVCQGMF